MSAYIKYKRLIYFCTKSNQERQPALVARASTLEPAARQRLQTDRQLAVARRDSRSMQLIARANEIISADASMTGKLVVKPFNPVVFLNASESLTWAVTSMGATNSGRSAWDGERMLTARTGSFVRVSARFSNISNVGDESYMREVIPGCRTPIDVTSGTNTPGRWLAKNHIYLNMAELTVPCQYYCDSTAIDGRRKPRGLAFTVHGPSGSSSFQVSDAIWVPKDGTVALEMLFIVPRSSAEASLVVLGARPTPVTVHTVSAGTADGGLSK